MSQKSTGFLCATYAYTCKHWLTFPHRQWEKGSNLCKSATRAAEQAKVQNSGLSLVIPDKLKHIYKDIRYTYLKQKTCAVLSIWINATIWHFILPIFIYFVKENIKHANENFYLTMFPWINPVVLRCHSLLNWFTKFPCLDRIYC